MFSLKITIFIVFFSFVFNVALNFLFFWQDSLLFELHFAAKNHSTVVFSSVCFECDQTIIELQLNGENVDRISIENRNLKDEDGFFHGKNSFQSETNI